MNQQDNQNKPQPSQDQTSQQTQAQQPKQNEQSQEAPKQDQNILTIDTRGLDPKKTAFLRRQLSSLDDLEFSMNATEEKFKNLKQEEEKAKKEMEETAKFIQENATAISEQIPECKEGIENFKQETCKDPSILNTPAGALVTNLLRVAHANTRQTISFQQQKLEQERQQKSQTPWKSSGWGDIFVAPTPPKPIDPPSNPQHQQHQQNFQFQSPQPQNDFRNQHYSFDVAPRKFAKIEPAGESRFDPETAKKFSQAQSNNNNF